MISARVLLSVVICSIAFNRDDADTQAQTPADTVNDLSRPSLRNASGIAAALAASGAPSSWQSASDLLERHFLLTIVLIVAAALIIANEVVRCRLALKRRRMCEPLLAEPLPDSTVRSIRFSSLGDLQFESPAARRRSVVAKTAAAKLALEAVQKRKQEAAVAQTISAEARAQSQTPESEDSKHELPLEGGVKTGDDAATPTTPSANLCMSPSEDTTPLDVPQPGLPARDQQPSLSSLKLSDSGERESTLEIISLGPEPRPPTKLTLPLKQVAAQVGKGRIEATPTGGARFEKASTPLRRLLATSPIHSTRSHGSHSSQATAGSALPSLSCSVVVAPASPITPVYRAASSMSVPLGRAAQRPAAVPPTPFPQGALALGHQLGASSFVAVQTSPMLASRGLTSPLPVQRSPYVSSRPMRKASGAVVVPAMSPMLATRTTRMSSGNGLLLPS